jgi:hypothetical protein
MLQFRGSVVATDAGLLAYRELGDALGLSAMAGALLADARTGKNGRHALVGMLRQSVFGRLAGYEDVNDAERLRHDPDGIRANFVRASASSSPICRGPPGMSSPSTTSAALQRIKEGKGAIKWTRLSCRSFAANAVRLQLHALAYDPGNFLRTLATPEPIKDWSITSLKEKLIKIGAKVSAMDAMPRSVFGQDRSEASAPSVDLKALRAKIGELTQNMNLVE